MQRNWFSFIVLLMMVSVLGYLSYAMVRPFLGTIVWAAVMALVFYPLRGFFSRRIRSRSLAALLVLVLILVILLGPVSYFSVLIVGEVKDLVNEIQGRQDLNLDALVSHPTLVSIERHVSGWLKIPRQDIEKKFLESVRALGMTALATVTGGIGNVATGFFDFLLMVFVAFFFLRDGPDILLKAQRYLPFSEAERQRLFIQAKDIVVSTIYGGVAVALAQGVIAGVSYYSLGVKSAVLWGFATAVASFLPIVGTAVIWVPIALYLLFGVSVVKGLVLIAIGVLVIGMVDNFVRPMIIGGKTNMPILIIFVSVLGGIQVFGLLGLIVGPLVTALFVSVVEILRSSLEVQDA